MIWVVDYLYTALQVDFVHQLSITQHELPDVWDFSCYYGLGATNYNADNKLIWVDERSNREL